MMKTKGYSKGGKMNTKGYAKGGKLEMVEKGGKKVPFYAADGEGKMAEGGAVKKITGGDEAQDAINKRAADAKKREDKSNKPRNLTAEEKKANKDKDMDTNMREAATKFGLKSGGKVKKSKTKGYAKGGKVRGAGIAKKGVKPCKMR